MGTKEEMIEGLKKNERAWCFLSDEEKIFLKSLSGSGYLLTLHADKFQKCEYPVYFGACVYRIRSDYEDETERYFFKTSTYELVKIRGNSCTFIYSMEEADLIGKTFPADIDRLIKHPMLIEVKECDLPYLKKPDGDWEFRKADVGDTWCAIVDGVIEEHRDTLLDAETFERSLSGYRWCRPRVEERYVEYDVYVSSESRYCFKDKQGHEFLLGSVVDSVGFAGVQFEGQSSKDNWSMRVASFIGKNGGLSARSDKGTPATPIRARFLVKGK